MRELALWVDAPYQNDAVFDPQSPLNRDDCLSSFRLLKAALAQKGWQCHTVDIYKAGLSAPDAVVFFDIPALPVNLLLGSWKGKTRPLVVLSECEVIKPRNWNLKLHGQFDALFTWNGRFVDNKKYFRLNMSNHFPGDVPDSPAARNKFCAMIAAHKKRPHPLELYSEREKTVRWFEDNRPGDFDLYGVGWDRRAFGGPAFARFLNRVKPLTKLFAPVFPSYRGTVALKKPVLEKYKFSICYENARDIPGYITEKIFDCFFAGCVPVYWGAPDIVEHVPETCFIDRRKFRSHEELHAFLKNIGEAELASRRAAIKAYLSGSAAYEYTDRYFADTVSGIIAHE